MSREAVTYKITIERTDGKQFRDDISEMEGRHSKHFIHFNADSYLSREYIENFKRSMFQLIDGELELFHNKQHEEKPQVCAACCQKLPEIKQ